MRRRKPTRVRRSRGRRPIKIRKPAIDKTHMDYVRKLVSKKLNRLGARANPMLREDMESAGMEALVRAHKNYNPKRSRFETLAHTHINFALNDVLNKQGPTKFSKKGFVKYRRGGGELHTKAPLEAAADVPGSGLEGVEAKLRIGSLLKRLPERDRKVMEMHAQGWPGRKIAKTMKVSPPRVAQIIKASQQKMRYAEAA